MPSPATAPAPHWFRVTVWSTLAGLAGIVAITAVAGVTGSSIVALVAASLLSGAVLGRLLWQPAANASLAGMPRALRVAFAVGALLLVGQLLFAAAFILDPTFTHWDARPWMPQRSAHSCVSSYWVACQAVDRTPAIYAESLYNLPQADPTAPRRPRPLGPFLVDNYEYPPAFLALPRPIALVTGDFWHFRRVWFALTLAVTLAGVALVARRLHDATGGRALWLTPYVLAAPAMIITTIVGNVQLAVISASMLAMLLIERRRHAAGGALLAYATLGKLFPGILLLYLLLRRDWRALGWTAAFAVAIVLITIADFGVAPYLAFAAELPQLLGGEAFSAFRNPVSIAVNESIPGIPFKLALFGVPHMGFAAAKVLGWAYTAVVVAVTARLALRPGPPERQPIAWLVILFLATMRSPFVATYAPFPSLWLATLLAAVTWGRSRAFATSIVAWAILAFTFGAGGAPPVVNAAWTFVHTVAAFVLAAIAYRLVGPGEVGVPIRSVEGVPA